MAGFFQFMRCVGRSVVKNGARALTSLVPLGEAVFEIARDAHEEYRRDKSAADLRADLESLAQASPAEVRQAAEQVAYQEAADQPLAVRLALVSYLDQLPASLRQSPRPSDQGSTKETHSVTVNSPKRTYTLLGLLAAGDVADVHLAAPRSDPKSAGETSYALKISRIPEGCVLLDNERAALSNLLTRAGGTTYRKYLPTLTESFAAKDKFRKRVNVFLYEPGFYTLEQIHDQHPALDGRHLAWIFKRLLTVLGFSHQQGTVHGAVLPCHVMIHAANHGLQLVGWGQSVATTRPIRNLAARYRDWYPSEVRRKQPATPATDLFLAARCLIYLAGGDPVRDRMPDTLPAPMRRFVKSCLLEGSKMRPDDAWELLDEFDELLRPLYGPPKFHELIMT